MKPKPFAFWVGAVIGAMILAGIATGATVRWGIPGGIILGTLAQPVAASAAEAAGYSKQDGP